MDAGLSGKRVLITAAAGGIGGAVALAFARENCELLLVDKDVASLEKVAT